MATVMQGAARCVGWRQL
uniref:Uncharacterized protein n=1 Tax=Arundo donax TaxID=35708 RepID=A0A0A9FVA7_ARUDO